MLSRVANNVYWMGRYLVRAASISRFLEVNFQLMLDQPTAESEQWKPLVQVTRDYQIFMDRYGSASRQNVMSFLTFDADNANSVLNCLARARENARTVREHLPSDLWEAINTFYHKVRDAGRMGMGADQDSCALYREIKSHGQLVAGIVEGLMTRGDGYHFYQAGCHMERADKTSRLLDVKYFILLPDVESVGTPLDLVQWGALLRSFGALEVYRRQFGSITPFNVATFLILDRCFPRSILYCLQRTDRALRIISGADTSNHHNRAGEVLSRVCADLCDRSMAEIFKRGLHEFIDDLQGRLNEIDTAIYATYFDTTHATEPREHELDDIEQEDLLEDILMPCL